MIGGAAVAGVFAMALPMIQQWEGRSLLAYRDIVGGSAATVGACISGIIRSSPMFVVSSKHGGS